MRVLHVHSGNVFGGVETLLVALARHQSLASTMRPAFALCFPGRLASELASLGRAAAMLGAVRIRRPWSVVRARRRLAALLRRRGPDVVVFHAPWSWALLGGVARRRGLPTVLWLHGPLRRGQWLDRLALRLSPALALCNSDFTQQSLDGLPRRPPSIVVHAPVTMPAGVPDDRASTRAALRVADDAVVLIQVGRLESTKGNRQHLEALARLRELPGWVSWHVGGAQPGAQRRHLRDLRGAARAAGLEDRVRFLGEREDVARLLRAADIYVQPNTSPDAFGLSFVEAMLSRLPVVTTGIGGALEVVDPRCGVLVPPGDVAALAATLRELIVDRSRRLALGASGPERARALCDPVRQMPAVDAALSSVLGAGVGATRRATAVGRP